MTETEQNKIPLPGEPEPRDPMLDFLKGDQWESADVGPYLLDFAKAYEAPRYTLSWQGVKFAPLGGIHAITGQAGNGKTESNGATTGKVAGISIVASAMFFTASSPSVTIAMILPLRAFTSWMLLNIFLYS